MDSGIGIDLEQVPCMNSPEGEHPFDHASPMAERIEPITNSATRRCSNVSIHQFADHGHRPRPPARGTRGSALAAFDELAKRLEIQLSRDDGI